MIVSSFPPGPQTIFRTLHFARYLPELGWTPVILTPRQDASPGRSVGTVPEDVAVFRATRLPTPSMLARRWAGRHAAPAPAGAPRPRRPSTGGRRRPSHDSVATGARRRHPSDPALAGHPRQLRRVPAGLPLAWPAAGAPLPAGSDPRERAALQHRARRRDPVAGCTAA